MQNLGIAGTTAKIRIGHLKPFTLECELLILQLRYRSWQTGVL
jgi:hypothetical protein